MSKIYDWKSVFESWDSLLCLDVEPDLTKWAEKMEDAKFYSCKMTADRDVYSSKPEMETENFGTCEAKSYNDNVYSSKSDLSSATSTWTNEMSGDYSSFTSVSELPLSTPRSISSSDASLTSVSSISDDSCTMDTKQQINMPEILFGNVTKSKIVKMKKLQILNRFVGGISRLFSCLSKN